MNTDVKNLKTGQMNQPCFCVFDIIYLNGEVLTNKSLSERIKILNKMILPQEGVLMKSNQDVVKSRYISYFILRYSFNVFFSSQQQ